MATIEGKGGLLERVTRLNEIGIALSKERDHNLLLVKIIESAKEMTHSDGGTLYIISPEGKLHFEIVRTDSLGIHLGGDSEAAPFDDIPLVDETGVENDTMMVAYAANHAETILVRDAYNAQGFDFSGTREFDKKTGYRTQAVLTVPIKSHEDEVIGVMQLINPIDPDSGEITPFTIEDQELVESLASQAGVAMSNARLIGEQKELFEALIRVIAEAIDEKSPSTGNHGRRVPILADMIARAVNQSVSGPFADTFFSAEELEELGVAAFLHDCGKITTPEHVVEKKTKLQTIWDRIELLDTRFKLAKKEAEVEFLRGNIESAEYEKKLAALEEDLAFIHRCNRAQEVMTPDAEKRIAEMVHQALLTENEAENLAIKTGNLTAKERKIIENHVVMTQKMLEQLPYPKHLRGVPEIAGSHHERVDGTGYPDHLEGDALSLRARILAIADVFEALSAPDRPYKKALPLPTALSMMEAMVNDGHLDPDLFKLFVDMKVAERYAEKHLSPDQLT